MTCEANQKFYRLACLAISASAIILALYCRIRLLSVPFERDEGGFAYVAQQLLRGIPPYESGNTMKLMGIHTAYALMLKLFGETVEGVRLGLLIVNQVSILLLYFLARRLMSLEGAIVACGFYALMSVSQAVLGIFAHATHFVTLFALAGLVTLLAAVERPGNFRLFLSGILFGLSVTMKQNGLLFCIFAAAYLLFVLISRKASLQETIRKAAILGSGMILPYAAVCCYMLYKGVFAEFWFWTVTYALDYAKGGAFQEERLNSCRPAWVKKPLFSSKVDFSAGAAGNTSVWKPVSKSLRHPGQREWSHGQY